MDSRGDVSVHPSNQLPYWLLNDFNLGYKLSNHEQDMAVTTHPSKSPTMGNNNSHALTSSYNNNNNNNNNNNTNNNHHKNNNNNSNEVTSRSMSVFPLPPEVMKFAPTRDSAFFTLIVNVPFSTSREDLNAVFGAFGKVDLSMVVCSAESRHPHREWTSTAGYAFVKFRRTEDAMKALYASSIGEIVIKGASVRADWAKKDSYNKNDPIQPSRRNNNTCNKDRRNDLSSGRNNDRDNSSGIVNAQQCYDSLVGRQLTDADMAKLISIVTSQTNTNIDPESAARQIARWADSAKWQSGSSRSRCGFGCRNMRCGVTPEKNNNNSSSGRRGQMNETKDCQFVTPRDVVSMSSGYSDDISNTFKTSICGTPNRSTLDMPVTSQRLNNNPRDENAKMESRDMMRPLKFPSRNTDTELTLDKYQSHDVLNGSLFNSIISSITRTPSSRSETYFPSTLSRSPCDASPCGSRRGSLVKMKRTDSKSLGDQTVSDNAFSSDLFLDRSKECMTYDVSDSQLLCVPNLLFPFEDVNNPIPDIISTPNRKARKLEDYSTVDAGRSPSSLSWLEDVDGSAQNALNAALSGSHAEFSSPHPLSRADWLNLTSYF